MFLLPCPILHVLMKENGNRSLWLPGVAFRSLSIHQGRNDSQMKTEQGGCKALQTKIDIFCQEEKVLKGVNCGFWGVGDGGGPGLELGVQGPLPAQSSPWCWESRCVLRALPLLGWRPGEMGRTSALMEGEDLKVENGKSSGMSIIRARSSRGASSLLLSGLYPHIPVGFGSPGLRFVPRKL